MTDARTKAIDAFEAVLGYSAAQSAMWAIDDAGLVLIDPTTFGDIVEDALEQRLARAGAWRAELETATYGDDPLPADDSPTRATFADGTEARDLNVGRLGLCGPEAMREAIEREEEQ